MRRNQWMGRKYSQWIEEELRAKFGREWMIEHPPANFEILQKYAEKHRVECPEYEYTLANHLRRRGLPIEHQVIYFNRYIVDLALINARTIIELDGEYHRQKSQIIKDEARDKIFISFGFDVHRWTLPMTTEQTEIKCNAFAKAYKRFSKAYSIPLIKRPTIVEKISIDGLVQRALALKKRVR